MTLWGTYKRALGLLLPEKWLVGGLVVSNVVVGLVLLAEPLLLTRVVDALTKGQEALPTIALWAALGLFGIFASVIVAIAADRLAHRRRLIAMSTAFERAINLPLSYHARKGSGTVIRAIQQGTDCLFGLWLAFMREHLASIVSVAFLIPTALSVDVRMASVLLVLGAVYLAANMFVFQHTIGQQAEVERYHRDLTGRVGDVLGNVMVVQSYVRLEAEALALRNVMSELLSAQYPVLTWWAFVTIITRAASTITMVAIFALGAVLVQRGELTVGQVVGFVAFANLLIGRLDQLSHFFLGLFNQKPAIDAYFDLVDTTNPVAESPNARALPDVKGHVRYDNVTFQFPDSQQGVFDLDFEAKPGQTIAMVGHTGSGKTTTLALLQRLRDPQEGGVSVDGVDIRDLKLSALRGAIGVVFQDAGLPFTGQTFGVLAVGAALGFRRAVMALLVYLAIGVAGVPVFAEGGAGVGKIVGATGGYLIGFLVAGSIVGRLAELGWDRRIGGSLATMAIGTAVIYAIGVPWLKVTLGLPWETAVAEGMTKFLIWDVAKLAVAAGIFPVAWWLIGRRPEDR